MTIKQQGGIFGRNPTFNDLTVEGTLTSSGTFAPSGQVTISEDGDAALVVNRNTDNGTIVQVKQANAEVGYIATQGGDLVVGTGDTSLRFIDSLDCYFPVSTSSGTTRDNAIDIGYTEARYKDLYLGGGIYLQALSVTPVAANYLDDYEEGTWTPVLTTSGTDFTSVTYDAAVYGLYTKIGNMVHIQGMMRTDAVNATGATGFPVISGLPFTSSSGSGFRDVAISISRVEGFTTNNPSSAAIFENGTRIWPQYRTTSNGAETYLPLASIGTGADNNIMYFAGTYTTD